MLYAINGKYYVLVSGYFKEVNVTKKGNDYNVEVTKDANETKKEASNVKDFTTITVEDACRNQSKKSEF